MATYTFYMPTIEGTVGGLIPEDISLPTLMSGDVLDLATKTITFSNKSTRKLTDEEVKSYHKHRKVIDLGGLEGARNTLEIKEDGSAVYTQNTEDLILNGSETTWREVAGNRYIVTVSNMSGSSSSVLAVLCDALNAVSWEYLITNNNTNFVSSTTNVFGIGNGYASSLEELKNKLKPTPMKVRYKLSTPIVTYIPKELVPTILTQATNTFSFGEAVAPYSVTIKAPTTDDVAKSYTVSLLNAYTQTVGTATPVVDLLKDGKVRLQMDLTAPTTGMNATIFTLPTELRPVTTQKIPVFVNGVCQLATIDKTTGNVNLASVPSASANIYIKTDYRRDI